MSARRERRKTAGQRMTVLVGKAQEEDDMFWGHDTWAEGSDSGNESFHESDEDSALRRDVFDSDFNDSESDNEADEIAAADEAESTLRRAEKRSKRKHGQYIDIASAGRELMAKKKGKGRKTVVGDGENAGIVLNIPAGAAHLHAAPVPRPSPSAQADSSAAAAAKKRQAPVQTSQVRVKSDSKSKSKKTASVPTTKMMRRKYRQEELLLEAVHETEPENRRWLLARKRVQDLADQEKDMLLLRDRGRSKTINKYHSRRGCLITLTFPEMDHVPEILARAHHAPAKAEKTTCAITGKPARYRDPLTGMGYHDIAAFKELRARHKQGRPLVTRREPVLAQQPENDDEMQTTNQATAPETASSSAGMKTKNASEPVVAVRVRSDTGLPESVKSEDDAMVVEKVAGSGTTTSATTHASTVVEPVVSATPSNGTVGDRPIVSARSDGTDRATGRLSSKSSSRDSTGVDKNDKATSATIRTTVASPNNERRLTSSNSTSSPSRSSTRRWKPSTKMLENLICDDKATTLASGALSSIASSRITNATRSKLHPRISAKIDGGGDDDDDRPAEDVSRRSDLPQDAGATDGTTST